MYHGNLEISKRELAEVRSQLDDHILDRLIEERCKSSTIGGRRILVVVQLSRDEARFVIRDEGRGFNKAYATSDPKLDRFTAGQSRGMTLIHSMMDEVTFNSAGNELTMRKCLQVPSAAGPKEEVHLP